ncbi:hypothetical protein PLESTB_001380200 [Pleodorina starrii]|uniref:Uncharacterized protein n=1 Tax=Pleodorina starrii TaxID=330485 RepID=A0A9W6BW42_9CHLO|nr:hypothetical protein PLESTM_000405000 [Pleodorina starrii]GLC58611.1 hypothetical protein PLESTB_001380200 [Pleodorina starrii]GLC67482.1 hypothetical protein PLESTF_000562200 [Pleodorina starrii]
MMVGVEGPGQHSWNTPGGEAGPETKDLTAATLSVEPPPVAMECATTAVAESSYCPADASGGIDAAVGESPGVLPQRREAATGQGLGSMAGQPYDRAPTAGDAEAPEARRPPPALRDRTPQDHDCRPHHHQPGYESPEQQEQQQQHNYRHHHHHHHHHLRSDAQQQHTAAQLRSSVPAGWASDSEVERPACAAAAARCRASAPGLTNGAATSTTTTTTATTTTTTTTTTTETTAVLAGSAGDAIAASLLQQASLAIERLDVGGQLNLGSVVTHGSAWTGTTHTSPVRVRLTRQRSVGLTRKRVLV